MTTYSADYEELKNRINTDDDCIELEGMTVRNYTFSSAAHEVLIGHSRYTCDLHGLTFESPAAAPAQGTGHDAIDNTDSAVEENRSFRYHIFFPGKKEKATSLVLFIHGFNEKSWDKYFPWAKKIALETGKAVALFPIAFHMNRAPQQWSDKRAMFALSRRREEQYPNLMKSSLSNAAISKRLHTHPDRFIWSGLESYYDLIAFVNDCKEGRIEGIDPACTFDFFAYSIGALLSEILLLTNHEGFFSRSKLCMFCGGSVFNRLSPVSKFILDSEANVALYSFLVEHLDSHMKRNPRLQHFMSKEHPEGYNFYAMLDYRVNRDYREQRFRDLQAQICAIALEQDTVVPAYEVVNTLQGIHRDTGVPVEVMDFPFEYSHENPFPQKVSLRGQVDAAFASVFDRVCRFLQ
jgi:hypothetical protein